MSYSYLIIISDNHPLKGLDISNVADTVIIQIERMDICKLSRCCKRDITLCYRLFKVHSLTRSGILKLWARADPRESAALFVDFVKVFFWLQFFHLSYVWRNYVFRFKRARKRSVVLQVSLFWPTTVVLEVILSYIFLSTDLQ